MRRAAILLARALLAASLAAPLAAPAQVQPGSWELTVTTQVQGAEKPLGPLIQTHCLTADDAANPQRVLGAGPGCEFSDRRTHGEVFEFSVKCGGPVPMSGAGRIRQDANSFEGELELRLDAGPAGASQLDLRSKVSGKRLGPCKS